jgi:hypothetical protein
MFLSITTAHQPATDLGFLLHKHPDRLHQIDLTFGKAWVFYPEATETRCEAALVLDRTLPLSALSCCFCWGWAKNVVITLYK